MVHLGPIARSVLVGAAMEAMPVILAGPPPMPGRGLRARAARVRVPALHAILPTTEAAARALASMGADPARIAPPGRLRELAAAPEGAEDPRRARLAAALSGRPVWFAAAVPEGEMGAVLTAHDAVLRRAHRAILILQAETAPPETLRGTGTLDGIPGEDARIVLARGADPPELSHRLAAVSYIGGGFSGGLRLPPGPAAALGSAILHGPSLGAQAAAMAPLALAGATARVPRPSALGDAVERHLSPDRAAALAEAAWAAVTEGAETTDRLAALIVDALDGVPPGDAAATA